MKSVQYCSHRVTHEFVFLIDFFYQKKERKSKDDSRGEVVSVNSALDLIQVKPEESYVQIIPLKSFLSSNILPSLVILHRCPS
jgi:hypothetical protein